MEEFGLLGKSLKHSYSPRIHDMLGEYTYKLFEREEDEVEDFIKNESWRGLNVTIPYKKTVLPYLTKISDVAKEAGSVNTIFKIDDQIYGENTDVYGFMEMVKKSGIDVCQKKTLVLGSGGASCAVVKGLKDLGAMPLIISRSGENNYENIKLHEDAQIIVNTTPLGMYPKVGVKPLDLSIFNKLDAVYDIIYNPARTEFVLQAEKLGIPAFGGLYMLVAQAMKSAELFMGGTISEEETDRIYKTLSNEMTNIILIGMPGCGKSSIARELGRILNREVVDSDEVIMQEAGRKPSDIIKELGEDEFRRIESEIIARIGMESGKIIATGGGAILREGNYDSLHQNGTIFWIRRDIEMLPTNDRPLSEGVDLNELFQKRKPFYEKFSDYSVSNENLNEAAKEIVRIVRTM